MFGKAINYLVDKLYDGNFVAFKIEPIVGTILSTGTIWGIDYHLALAKVVGTAFLAIMSVTIGVMWPWILRWWLHKKAKTNPFIAELLKHDKKESE